MPVYRERLWPAPWLFFGTALVIPASLVVFAPINMIAGIITAIVLYGGCVLWLITAATVVEVTDTTLQAGKAKLPLSLAGEAAAFSGQAAWQQRGPKLDARAWLAIRGWVDGVVTVPVLDEKDPAPYWVVSTRHPKELAAAINLSRRPTITKE